MSLSNVTPTSCARWRAALARQALGGAVATAFCGGDSNAEDAGALFEWHEVARALLQAAQPDTWDEGFAYFTAPSGLDSGRRTYGTNWSIVGTGQAGPALNATLLASAPGGTPFEYGPVDCDTFRLYFRRFGGGSFSWAVDGGSVSAPVSVAGAGEAGYIDIPAGAPGPHTLELHALVTGVQPQFLGVGWTDSTSPRRRIAASGRFGAGTDDWTATPSLEDVYEAIAPDLTIPLIGSNDYGFHGLSTATTLANLETWIDTAAAADSDFLLMVPAPSDYSSGATVEPPADLVTGLHALSADKDVPIYDLKERWVDFNTAKLVNGYISDHVHFTDPGHADIGAGLAAAILAMGGEDVPPDLSGDWEAVAAERWNGSGWETLTAERYNGTIWTPVTMERAL